MKSIVLYGKLRKGAIVTNEYCTEIHVNISISSDDALLSAVFNESMRSQSAENECYTKIENVDRYLSRCRKRSILDKTTLMECWKKNDGNVVVVDFLLIHRFPKIVDLYSKSVYPLLTGNHMRQIPIQISKNQYKEIIKDTKYESYNDFD